MSEMKSLTLNGTKYDSFVDQTAREMTQSGGSGKAKTQTLLDVTFEELTASVSITLEHNIHRVFVFWSANGSRSRLVNEDGTAVAGTAVLAVDTTSTTWNARNIGILDATVATWESGQLVVDYTDDCSVLLNSTRYTYQTGLRTNIYSCYGGVSAVHGIASGTENLKAGNSLYLNATGGLFNIGSRVVIIGEYFD